MASKKQRDYEHDQSKVQVCVRCRPFIASDTDKSGRLLSAHPESASVALNVGGDGRQALRTFRYDQVFGPDATQQRVFEKSGAQRLVQAAVDGYHATVFAYGQTSSGKTHSMEGFRYRQGKSGQSVRADFDVDEESLGLAPRALKELFDGLERRKAKLATDESGRSETVSVKVSYIQVYMEQVYDMLTPGGTRTVRGEGRPTMGRPEGGKDDSRKRRLRWNSSEGFYVENLFMVECASAEEALAALRAGVRNKVMAQHNANAASSRSHCVFTLHVEKQRSADTAAAGVHELGATACVKSRLSLVDLAGSERVATTGAKGVTLRESTTINRSLFVLRQVIIALAETDKRSGGGKREQGKTLSRSHIPYRDSKLTSLLKHSLGGNGLTLMIACLAPCDSYLEENLSTLEYASTAKRIEVAPVVNEDANTRLVRRLRQQISDLREQLAQSQGLLSVAAGGGKPSGGGSSTAAFRTPAAAAGGHGGGGSTSAASPRSGAQLSVTSGLMAPRSEGTAEHPVFNVANLGSNLVESVSLLKRMVSSNAELLRQASEQAQQLQGLEKSNEELMQENQELRDRLDIEGGGGGGGGGSSQSSSANSGTRAGSAGSAGSYPVSIPSAPESRAPERSGRPERECRGKDFAAMERAASGDFDSMMGGMILDDAGAATAAAGSGGGGGGGDPMLHASGLHSQLGAEAAQLKADNDALELRLQALTSDAMLGYGTGSSQSFAGTPEIIRSEKPGRASSRGKLSSGGSARSAAGSGRRAGPAAKRKPPESARRAVQNATRNSSSSGGRGGRGPSTGRRQAPPSGGGGGGGGGGGEFQSRGAYEQALARDAEKAQRQARSSAQLLQQQARSRPGSNGSGGGGGGGSHMIMPLPKTSDEALTQLQSMLDQRTQMRDPLISGSHRGIEHAVMSPNGKGAGGRVDDGGSVPWAAQGV